MFFLVFGSSCAGKTSALALLRNEPARMRKSVGHIHYFDKDTALAALRETGHEIVDWRYTSGRTELPNLGWKTRLLKGPRNAAYAVNPDFAAKAFGGYSLLVLAT